MNIRRAFIEFSTGFLAIASCPAISSDLAPEQLFHAQPNTAACMSKDALDEFVGHLANGEITKAKGMFLEYICFTMPTNRTYRIIDLRATEMEFVPKNSQAAHGLWTFPSMAIPGEAPEK